MKPEEEPAQMISILMGIGAALLTGVVSWAAGADVRASVGIAAANLGAFFTTGRLIRDRVFSPATMQRLTKASRQRGLEDGRKQGGGGKSRGR